MKRYILSVAVLLMIGGVVNAQTTKKTAKEKPAVTKPATPMKKEKKPEAVKPATTATTTTSDKTAGTAPIKRKTHSKSKSVPASK